MVRKARAEEILHAAAKVFSEKGFHATRIQDVADELGMQKGSLYYYISSKEDLVQGLVAGALERMIREASSILATGHGAGRKLAMLIEAHLRHAIEDRYVWSIHSRESLELLNRNSPADIRVLVDRYERLWDRAIAEGVASGELKADLDQRVTMQALLSMCTGLLTWFDPEGRLPAQEVARIYAEIVLHGVQNPQAGTTQAAAMSAAGATAINREEEP